MQIVEKSLQPDTITPLTASLLESNTASAKTTPSFEHLDELFRNGGPTCISRCLSNATVEAEIVGDREAQVTLDTVVRIGERPAQRYELALLLNAAGADLSVEALRHELSQTGDDTRVLSFGLRSGAVNLVLDNPGDLSAASPSAAVRNQEGLCTLSSELREADMALRMGQVFANRMKEHTPSVEHGLNADQSLGTFALQGKDRFLALAAFIDRTTTTFRKSVEGSRLDSLDEIATHLPSRSTVVEHGCLRVKCDTHTVAITQGPEDTCMVELLLNPRGLQRQPDKWFATSATADELRELLGEVGVLKEIPKLAKFLSEVEIECERGNGYASLSRRLVDSMYRSVDSYATRLRALATTTNFMERLEAACEKSQLTSTKQILDLLRAIASPSQPPKDLPSYRSFSSSNDSWSCAESEGNFVIAVRDGLFMTDRHFIRKSVGAGMALSTVPISVDGVAYPAGTLCDVKVGQAGEMLVRPVRLTMFSLPLEEGREVYRYHYDRAGSHVGDNDQHVSAVYEAMKTVATLPQVNPAPSVWSRIKAFLRGS